MPTKDQQHFAVAPIVTAALLCALFTVGCNQAHAALASTFGGLAVVTLALPALVLACPRGIGRILVIAASVLAIVTVWISVEMSWPQWWACAMILAAYAAAIAGTAIFFNRMGAPATVSAMTVIVLALAWLAWPIWLSPWLAGNPGWVNWLVFAHPLLAINGVLIDQGIWTERPRMYGWTALNQDVPYSMPTTICWCVVIHLGVALVTMIAPPLRMFTSRKAEQPARGPAI